MIIKEEGKVLDMIVLQLLKEIEAKNYCYESIASKCHMSLSTFHRKVRQLRGYTPANFINYIKIRHDYQILDALDQKNLTLREIEFELGYTDLAYLSRVFKKHIGISPSDYRDLKSKGEWESNNFKLKLPKLSTMN